MLEEFFANTFELTTDKKFCTHVDCVHYHIPVIKPVDPVIMYHFAFTAPLTFPWMLRSGKWSRTKTHVSQPCAIHFSEWVDHLIATEIVDATATGRTYDSDILSYSESAFLRDLVHNGNATTTRVRKPRRRVKPDVITYVDLPVVNTQKYTNCVICYTESNIVSFACNHTVCYDCLLKINKTCPYCRQPWVFKECKRVKDLFEIVE